MHAFLLVTILIQNILSIQIEQLPKQFKIKENSPGETVIGRIQTNPSNYLITLIDNANGKFLLNSIGQLIVSIFIYSCPES